jgi:hypothetical protein
VFKPRNIFHNHQMHPGLRLTIAVSGALLIVGTLFWLLAPSQPSPISNLNDSWVLKENRNGPVIGHLGGAPVAIPKPFAHFVEYDGDPHFMERRKGPPPKRTYQSGLASFGFEIRYPDMAALTDQTEPQKKTETIYTTTWLDVGIHANSIYGGDTALEAYIQSIVYGKNPFPPYRYEKLPEQVYGLTGYTPIGFDISKRSGTGTSYSDRNIYFHRTPDGTADAYIECSNVEHAAAPCELKFNTLPEMRVQVDVGFRKGLLPHWQEIRSSVKQVILGFRVNPSSASPSVPAVQPGK